MVFRLIFFFALCSVTLATCRGVDADVCRSCQNIVASKSSYPTQRFLGFGGSKSKASARSRRSVFDEEELAGWKNLCECTCHLAEIPSNNDVRQRVGKFLLAYRRDRTFRPLEVAKQRSELNRECRKHLVKLPIRLNQINQEEQDDAVENTNTNVPHAQTLPAKIPDDFRPLDAQTLPARIPTDSEVPHAHTLPLKIPDDWRKPRDHADEISQVYVETSGSEMPHAQTLPAKLPLKIPADWRKLGAHAGGNRQLYVENLPARVPTNFNGPYVHPRGPADWNQAQNLPARLPSDWKRPSRVQTIPLRVPTRTRTVYYSLPHGETYPSQWNGQPEIGLRQLDLQDEVPQASVLPAKVPSGGRHHAKNSRRALTDGSVDPAPSGQPIQESSTGRPQVQEAEKSRPQPEVETINPQVKEQIVHPQVQEVQTIRPQAQVIQTVRPQVQDIQTIRPTVQDVESSRPQVNFEVHLATNRPQVQEIQTSHPVVLDNAIIQLKSQEAISPAIAPERTRFRNRGILSRAVLRRRPGSIGARSMPVDEPLLVRKEKGRNSEAIAVGDDADAAVDDGDDDDDDESTEPTYDNDDETTEPTFDNDDETTEPTNDDDYSNEDDTNRAAVAVAAAGDSSPDLNQERTTQEDIENKLDNDVKSTVLSGGSLVNGADSNGIEVLQWYTNVVKSLADYNAAILGLLQSIIMGDCAEVKGCQALFG